MHLEQETITFLMEIGTRYFVGLRSPEKQNESQEIPGNTRKPKPLFKKRMKSKTKPWVQN